MISAGPFSSSATFARRVVLVLAGSALLYLSAKIALPAGPWGVPVTMQTLAIPVLVALLGRNLAVGATLAYLAEGFSGLPVFSSFGFLAPSLGYLVGFPIAAFIVGELYARGFAATYVRRLAAILIGTAAVLVCGATWLGFGFTHSAVGAVTFGIAPFIVGELLKSVLAAGLKPRT